MTTGATYAAVTETRLFGTADMRDRLLGHLRSLVQESYEKSFRGGCVYDAALSLVSGGNDAVSVSGSSGATDGQGHLLDVAASGFATALQFENTAAVEYEVGLHYAEVPSGVQVNPRSGMPEFIGYDEQIGESGDPDLVTDNGNGTITFRVNTVTESGVSNAGRKVRVWKNTPGPNATTEAVAVEELTVSWTGGNNEITTAAALGQDTVSTTVADYTVVLMGPTIKRNSTLYDVDGYAYLGKVTGGGAGSPPSGYDITDQDVIDMSLSDLADITSRNATTDRLKIDVKSYTGDVNDPQIQVRDPAGSPVFTVDGNGNVVIEGTTTQQDFVQVNSSETITDNLTAGDDDATDSHKIKGTWWHTNNAETAYWLYIDGTTGRVGINKLHNASWRVDISGNVRIDDTLRIESAEPIHEYRETDVAVDAGGLWRWHLSGGNVELVENTAAGGDFSTASTWVSTDRGNGAFEFAKHVWPAADDTYDLGASGQQYRDAYIDGTAYVDVLSLSTAASEGVGTDFFPTADGTYDLGGSGREWQDLWIDGVAYVDTLSMSTAAGEGCSTDFLPTGDNTLDLGAPGYQWANVYVVNLNVGEDINPAADLTYDLGQPTVRWLNVYTQNISGGADPVYLLSDTWLQSAMPQFVLRETDVAVDAGGLWRHILSAGDVYIQENTAAGGDFSTSNTWVRCVRADTQVRIRAHLTPSDTGSTRDLGASGREWRDLHLDGTANIDLLVLSTSASEGVGSHLYPSGAAFDLGGASRQWRNLYLDGTATIDLLVLSTASNEGIGSHLYPDTDGSYDLGGSGREWQDLWIDGSAYIDTLWLSTASGEGVAGGLHPVSDSDIGMGATGRRWGVFTGSQFDMYYSHTAAANWLAKFTRHSTTATNTLVRMFELEASSDGVIADGFGGDLYLMINNNDVAYMKWQRDGADDQVIIDWVLWNGSAWVTPFRLSHTGTTYHRTILPLGAFDLGSSGTQWQNLWIDGTANVDLLVLSTAASEGVGSHLYPSGASFDLGGASRQWQNLWIDGTANVDLLVLSTSASEGVGSHLYPSGASFDLGGSGREWQNLWIDGTANIDLLVLSTAASEGVGSHLYPDTHATYDMGTDTVRWQFIYAQSFNAERTESNTASAAIKGAHVNTATSSATCCVMRYDVEPAATQADGFGGYHEWRSENTTVGRQHWVRDGANDQYDFYWETHNGTALTERLRLHWDGAIDLIGDLMPGATTSTYDMGSSSYRWGVVYCSYLTSTRVVTTAGNAAGSFVHDGDTTNNVPLKVGAFAAYSSGTAEVDGAGGYNSYWGCGNEIMNQVWVRDGADDQFDVYWTTHNGTALTERMRFHWDGDVSFTARPVPNGAVALGATNNRWARGNIAWISTYRESDTLTDMAVSSWHHATSITNQALCCAQFAVDTVAGDADGFGGYNSWLSEATEIMRHYWIRDGADDQYDVWWETHNGTALAERIRMKWDGDIDLRGHIMPGAIDRAYDIGSATYRWGAISCDTINPERESSGTANAAMKAAHISTTTSSAPCNVLRFDVTPHSTIADGFGGYHEWRSENTTVGRQYWVRDGADNQYDFYWQTHNGTSLTERIRFHWDDYITIYNLVVIDEDINQLYSLFVDNDSTSSTNATLRGVYVNIGSSGSPCGTATIRGMDSQVWGGAWTGGASTITGVYGQARRYGSTSNDKTYGGWFRAFDNGSGGSSLNFYGVYAEATGTTSYGVYCTGGNYGLYSPDTKAWVNPHPTDPTKSIVYATVEAEKDTAMLRGRAQLTNGRAVIVFPEHFAMTASELPEEPVHVMVTPRSAESKGIAVISSDNEGFEAVELAGGSGTYEFDYVVTAARRGYEDREPIVDNVDFVPGEGNLAKYEGEVQDFYDRKRPGVQRILKSAGILKANGQVNESLFTEKSWKTGRIEKPKEAQRG